MKSTLDQGNSEFLYCYSPNLFQFLRFGKCIPFIHTAYHITTKKQFWLFRRTPEVQQALTEYREGKNQKILTHP